MTKVLQTYSEKCVGCRLCEMACSFRHADGFNRANSMIKCLTVLEGWHHFVVTCLQCINPYCAEACPVEAIKKDERLGIVTINQEECTGCGECSEVCQFGINFFDMEGKALKCDHCGGDPECVAFCPTGALQYEEVERIDFELIEEKFKKLQSAFQMLTTQLNEKIDVFISLIEPK